MKKIISDAKPSIPKAVEVLNPWVWVNMETLMDKYDGITITIKKDDEGVIIPKIKFKWKNVKYNEYTIARLEELLVW